MTRLMSTLALALLFLGATGCASYSEDRSVFHSTAMSPKTYYVIDVISGETVWTYDIPPGHVLMVEFDVEKGAALESIRQERGYPNYMEWALYHESAGRSLLRKNHFRGTAVERGEQTLPGRPIRQGFTIGEPVDPATIAPPVRSIEDIQRDINQDDLPEPDAPEQGAEDAAGAVEQPVEE